MSSRHFNSKIITHYFGFKLLKYHIKLKLILSYTNCTTHSTIKAWCAQRIMQGP